MDDCLPDQICCAPPPQCIGKFSGEPGRCFFFQCPPNTYYEGSKPPDSESDCPSLYACCTQPDPEWIERQSINPTCIYEGKTGIKTAVGCIPITNPTNFLSFILPWAIGVAGGTAFILIVVAGFLIMTSSGNPQRTRAGKELLTAAIAGLLMIIFSVFILDLIGIRILKIPGL